MVSLYWEDRLLPAPGYVFTGSNALLTRQGGLCAWNTICCAYRAPCCTEESYGWPGRSMSDHAKHCAAIAEIYVYRDEHTYG